MFALLMGFLQLFLSPHGDDIAYSVYFKQYSLISFCQMVVNDWSSRVIIMPIAAFFADGRFNIFLVINTVGYFLLPFFISKIFVKKGDRMANWILVFLLFTVPLLEMMQSAGWLVTNIHYFWPLIFGFIGLYPIKKVFFDEKIVWYEYLIYFLATIFAANMEIMAAVLVAFYFIFTVYFLVLKKKHWLMFAQSAIVFLSLVVALLCPGNSVRGILEIQQYFPEYIHLELLDKIVLSLTPVITSIDPNLIFIAITMMMGIYIFMNFQKILPRIMGFFPLILCLLINFFRLFREGIRGSDLIKWMVGSDNYESVQFEELMNVIPGDINYLIFFLVGLFYFALLTYTFIIFKDSKWLWLAVLVLTCGIMTRLVMGLSPTVFASGNRTFLFQYVANAVYGLIFFLAFPRFWREKAKNIFVIAIGAMGSLGYCISLFRVIF